MRVIKTKFKCSICGNEYEHKVNPDSRGFFIVPKIHCAKDYIEMLWTIDGHGKNPDGEEEVDGNKKEG
jgi:hypothetical protein